MQKEEQRKRHDQWRVWIEEQAKSSLTQKTFCEQKGMMLVNSHIIKQYLNKHLNRRGVKCHHPICY